VRHGIAGGFHVYRTKRDGPPSTLTIWLDASIPGICYLLRIAKTGEDALIYLPIITSGDYAAFQKPLQNQIPFGYDKWLRLHAMWHHHYSAERHAIRNVHVSPHRFASHLKATGHAANLDELLIFAEIIAKEKPH
jgi:hypothetical protein